LGGREKVRVWENELPREGKWEGAKMRVWEKELPRERKWEGAKMRAWETYMSNLKVEFNYSDIQLLNS
jgi:hypothetical protein